MPSPSLRRRIVLTLLPLVLLLAAVGGAGVVLLRQLGQRSDAILRENYDSVRAMSALTEAADRMGRAETPAAHAAARREVAEQVAIEAKNLTILPDEPALLAELEAALKTYDAAPEPRAAHLPEIKAKANAILRLNHEQMERANQAAQRTARESLVGFGLGLAVAAVVALLLAVRLTRVILKPIEDITAAAEAVGAGQLHRTVPVGGADELGRLAATFNAMSAQVREFRQSNLRQLIRARETAQAAIDSFSDPVLVLDPEGRVELANPAAATVFGVSPGSTATWSPPPALQPAIDAALRAQQPTVTDRFDQAVVFRVGAEDRYYLPEVRPIRTAAGDTLGAAVVLDDVTRFRLLDQLKGDLVATASHELKTPLTGLRLAIHLLLEEAVGPLTPKQTELLLDARENAERLLSMVEQLLALARLEDRKDELRIAGHPVATLLQAAADGAADRAADSHLALTIDDVSGVPSVSADADRLGHALDNLVTNAIHHTPAGGAITLSAKAVDGERVELAVRDTGRGIPPEAMGQLFERFYRVPGDDQSTGTGLGLAIVREILEAHGGTVRCESEVGRGTAFFVTLPVWKGAPA